MTTAKPPARYGAMCGARTGGFALPSYTITGDTTFSPLPANPSRSAARAGIHQDEIAKMQTGVQLR